MAGWKVRLGDGSEIGPMDLAALHTWLAQGLVDGDSPVMRPGSRKWVALATIPELKGALGASRPKADSRPGARAARRPADTETDGADESRPSICGGCGSSGSCCSSRRRRSGTWPGAPPRRPRPSTARRGCSSRSAALALGLALLPGWDLARRGVRVALLLVAFALFPLAGILIAQGERGAGLLALASVWLFASGLAALLPRTLGWAGVTLALLPVLAAGYGAWRFGRAPESDASRHVREVGLRRSPLHRRRARPHPRRPRGLGGPQARQPARGRARRGAAHARPAPARRLRLPPRRARAEGRGDRRPVPGPAGRPPRRRAAGPRAGPAGERARGLPGGPPPRLGLARGWGAPARGRGGGARRLDGLRPRGLDAGGDGLPPRRARRARAGPRGARPAGRPPAGGGRRGGERGAAPLDPGRRAAHGPERGARPRARPGLPPLARRPRPAAALALEGRDAGAHRPHDRDLRRRAVGRSDPPRRRTSSASARPPRPAPRRTARWRRS